MDDFPLFKITAVSSALAAGFSIVGLVVAICNFFSRSQIVSIKLLGSLMVLALAFAANSAVVYFLAIFIVATLVTDLDFLEKIAAIFWNRDKYWEYRMVQIPPADVKARVASEAQQEVEAERAAATETEVEPTKIEEGQAPSIKSFVTDAISFERAVTQALAAGKGPFTPARINANRRLRSSSGNVEFDAIVETPAADYVVEIKYSKRPHVLLNALAMVERGVRAYRAYLDERGIEKEVVPVAIIPAGVSAPSLFQDVLPILRFDSTKHEFVNQEEFLAAVGSMRGTEA